MLITIYANSFKKDYKKLYPNQKDKVLEVINKLTNDELLEEKYHDHPLKGNYIGRRECHVEPNLLLVYKKTDTHLHLERIASHSELF